MDTKLETVIENVDTIRLYQMKVQLAALKLEIIGLKSRHGSIATLLRKKYGFVGAAKQSIFDQFSAYIGQRENELKDALPLEALEEITEEDSAE